MADIGKLKSFKSKRWWMDDFFFFNVFLKKRKTALGDWNISSPLRFHLFQELLTEATINILTTRRVAVNIFTTRHHVLPDRPCQTEREPV